MKHRCRLALLSDAQYRIAHNRDNQLDLHTKTPPRYTFTIGNLHANTGKTQAKSDHHSRPVLELTASATQKQ